jgi:hypothetical protein
MSLNKFVPLSPDPYITSDPEMTLAKFGHLNTIVDYLNGTNALTNIKIAGINNTAGYIDFSANPTGSTTVVGAIRTYVNGVNLSEVMEFREDGNIKVGGILSVGNYANSTGFGQKIRVIGQGDASLGIYRNQASTSAAKLEFMKSRGTYDTPVVVNANDLIGSVGFFGYNGTSYSNAAYIASAALSTSATGVEGDVRFILYNNTGGNYNPMRITKEGVGIGNALDYIPSATLQVRGSGSSSATTSLLVQNSAGTKALEVVDNGTISTFNNEVVINKYTVGGLIMSITTGQHFGARGINVTAGETGIIANSHYGVSTNSPLGASIVANGGASSGGFSLGLLSRRALISTAANALDMSNSAMLQADSTTQGFLPPRMTTAQKNLIATPATGLQVHDTDLNRPCFYNGTSWVTL